MIEEKYPQNCLNATAEQLGEYDQARLLMNSKEASGQQRRTLQELHSRNQQVVQLQLSYSYLF